MMDSIFQIKINENKLQRILNELSKNQNCFIEELAHSIHPHPTVSEVIKEAAHAVMGHPINM
mgnify:CR=1 FL=1